MFAEESLGVKLGFRGISFKCGGVPKAFEKPSLSINKFAEGLTHNKCGEVWYGRGHGV
jgi:hypothetical protein